MSAGTPRRKRSEPKRRRRGPIFPQVVQNPTWRENRNRPCPMSDHDLLATACNDHDDAPSTPPVNPSSPFTRPPTDNSAPGEPCSPTPTQPCPNNTKPDVDERNESQVFSQDHVRWMQRSQEERPSVYFVLKESEAQTSALYAHYSCDLLTGSAFGTHRDKVKPSQDNSTPLLHTTQYTVFTSSSTSEIHIQPRFPSERPAEPLGPSNPSTLRAAPEPTTGFPPSSCLRGSLEGIHRNPGTRGRLFS